MSQVKLTTNFGAVTIQLDAEKAPKTVENFLAYVAAGHYDNTVFHRVIKGFMIQGGGYDSSYAQRRTRDPIENEAKNGLKNARGTIAMARTGEPHSASSQFYINHVDNGSLDYPSFDGWGYAVFGKVIDGMDVVDRIAETQTGSARPFGRDVPVEQIVITQATVV